METNEDEGSSLFLLQTTDRLSLGSGVVRRLFEDDVPLWPNEPAGDPSVYPLRIPFDRRLVLDDELWGAEGAAYLNLKLTRGHITRGVTELRDPRVVGRIEKALRRNVGRE